jgi:threonine aldolase
MRQAGVLAAAGRYALRHHIERLAEDHEHAKRLASGIADVVPGVCDPAGVETNMVLLDLTDTKPDAAALAATCSAEGVLVSSVAPRRVRLVTHLDVDSAGTDRALEVIRRALTG